MNMQKQQSTAHNSKNDTWTIAEYDKSHQNTAGTQNDTTSPRAIRLKPTACICSLGSVPAVFQRRAFALSRSAASDRKRKAASGQSAIYPSVPATSNTANCLKLFLLRIQLSTHFLPRWCNVWIEACKSLKVGFHPSLIRTVRTSHSFTAAVRVLEVVSRREKTPCHGDRE